MSCFSFARNYRQEMLFWFVVVSLIVSSVKSHPQCLDSQPPFKPRGNVIFCKDHSRLGCCTEQNDVELKLLYEKSLRRVANQTQCQKYLSRAVCLKCHPWSAHLFNAESNPNFNTQIALPCFKHGYCQRLMKKCRKAVEYIWGDALKTRNISLDDFCRESEVVSNKDYCYPRIRRTLKRLRSSKLSNTASGLSGSNKGCLCVKEIARDLRSPLALVHANDQTHRMFVVEQIGVVHVILASGTKLSSPFLNITEKVLTTPAFGDERGLLGMAFHPKYRQNGRLFVYYITKRDRNAPQKGYRNKWWLSSGGLAILSEFRVSKNDPNQVEPQSEKIILKIEQPAPNHNGGQLLFGDDDLLYVFPGDGGRAGDPFGQNGNGLNKSSLLGKVLRIDIDKTNGKSYKVPADNPFVNERNTRAEIYAYGVRNMWRCSVDRGHRATGYGKGRMFCGDVGQNKYEEIDIVVKGGNYGWRGREGYKCYDKRLCNSSLLANEILPIHVYSHEVGQSIVGGYVYRGCNYPKLRGLYFFADTMNGRMFTLKENRKTGKWLHKEVCMGDHRYCTGPALSGTYAKMILSFGEDEAGELYMLSTEYTDNEAKKGAVYQLVDPERRADPSECKYTVKEPANLGCKDELSLCKHYKNKNYCKKYPKYMTAYCKRTCNKC